MEYPCVKKEARWLINTQGIRTIVTIKEKPLSQEWLNYNNGTNTSADGTKIDYLYISVHYYGAPSLEELDRVANYISQQIDRARRNLNLLDL